MITINMLRELLTTTSHWLPISLKWILLSELVLGKSFGLATRGERERESRAEQQCKEDKRASEWGLSKCGEFAMESAKGTAKNGLQDMKGRR